MNHYRKEERKTFFIYHAVTHARWEVLYVFKSDISWLVLRGHVTDLSRMTRLFLKGIVIVCHFLWVPPLPPPFLSPGKPWHFICIVQIYAGNINKQNPSVKRDDFLPWWLIFITGEIFSTDELEKFQITVFKTILCFEEVSRFYQTFLHLCDDIFINFNHSHTIPGNCMTMIQWKRKFISRQKLLYSSLNFTFLLQKQFDWLTDWEKKCHI